MTTSMTDVEATQARREKSGKTGRAGPTRRWNVKNPHDKVRYASGTGRTRSRKQTPQASPETTL